MRNRAVSLFLAIFVVAAVGYPVWVGWQGVTWSAGFWLEDSFPLFGLAAVALLWIHSLSGVFESWLRQHINFDWFIAITSTIILICIVLHPLLLLLASGFNVFEIFANFTPLYLWLGIIAWFLLITYDVGNLLKRLGYYFFVRHRTAILVISNIGFLITFLHSLALGNDLQSGPLRGVWVFYGISGALSLVYTYAIRPCVNALRL